MTNKVLKQTLHTIRKYQMLSSGDTVLVAISGGADSLCLLHTLISLQEDLDIDINALHVDHALRPESGTEAAFVQDLCQGLGVQCRVERIAVQEHCDATGRSFQETARLLRYRVLNDMAESIGANRIAVGHTADDQAETVLMRLLKGTGGTGLA